MKQLIAKLFNLLGWLVFVEQQLCDVVACRIRNGHRRIVCSEAERSTRNLIRNVIRDFSRGCDTVLIVVPDEALRGAVFRKLKRELPQQVRRKVAVVTIGRIENTIRRLETIHSVGDVR